LVAVCTRVPGGDRTGTVARRVHDLLPLLLQPGHVHGGHGELRHQLHPEVGLAPLARRRPRPGRRRHCRRCGHPRHAQQPGAAWEARRGPRFAAAHPRGWGGVGRHRCGAQGHRPRSGARPQTRVRRVPAPVPARVPPPPPHRRGHSGVLRPDGRDRRFRIHAAPLLHRRVHQPEGHPGLHHHRRGQPGVHRGGRSGRRPLRPPLPPHAGKRRSDPLPGGHGVDLWRAAGHRWRQVHAAWVRGRGGGAGVRVHCRVRRVVGPDQVGGHDRDLPAGGEAGGAGPRWRHIGGAHLRAVTVVPGDAVQLQVRHLLVLRRVGGCYGGGRGRVPAGDPGRAYRVHGRGVGEALVLEALRQAQAVFRAHHSDGTSKTGGWARMSWELRRFTAK
jgi:hypothetical protein